MQQTGWVITNEKGWALLEIIRPSACKGCGMCKPSDNAKRVKAICDMEVGKGDLVVVEMKDGDVLKAAAVAYGVPLLGFLAGVVTGNGFASYFKLQQKADAFAAAGGFLFLIMAYLGVRKYDLGLDSRKFAPVVTGFADPGSESCFGKSADIQQ